MVQMDFPAANHVCIVGLCGHAHCAVIFVIAQLSCFHSKVILVSNSQTHRRVSVGRIYALHAGGAVQ